MDKSKLVTTLRFTYEEVRLLLEAVEDLAENNTVLTEQEDKTAERLYRRLIAAKERLY